MCDSGEKLFERVGVVLVGTLRDLCEFLGGSVALDLEVDETQVERLSEILKEASSEQAICFLRSSEIGEEQLNNVLLGGRLSSRLVEPAHSP